MHSNSKHKTERLNTLAKHTFSRRPSSQSAQQLWDELALAKTPAVPTYALAEKCAIPAARAQRNR